MRRSPCRRRLPTRRWALVSRPGSRGRRRRVSGGADSTCLWHVLRALGYRVRAVHVATPWPAEADADARTVPGPSGPRSSTPPRLNLRRSPSPPALPADRGAGPSRHRPHRLQIQIETVLYRIERLTCRHPPTAQGRCRPAAAHPLARGDDGDPAPHDLSVSVGGTDERRHEARAISRASRCRRPRARPISISRARQPAGALGPAAAPSAAPRGVPRRPSLVPGYRARPVMADLGEGPRWCAPTGRSVSRGRSSGARGVSNTRRPCRGWVGHGGIASRAARGGGRCRWTKRSGTRA